MSHGFDNADCERSREPASERVWMQRILTPTSSCLSHLSTPASLHGRSAPGNAFSRLPNEILMRIIHYLEPPSATCLALTCRHLKAVMFRSTKMPLRALCKSRFKRVWFNQVEHWKRTGEQAQLMYMLRSWMPARYYLCESFAKYYLKGGNHMCSVCCPRRNVKQENMFDAEYWKNVPWTLLLGGVQRTILAAGRGKVKIRWTENLPARWSL